MTAPELVADLQRQGFCLTPLPGGKLEVKPASRLTEELRAELRRRKEEVLALLSHSWPCPHCGKPATITDVSSSRDGTYRLTFWHCEPCQRWACTPSDLREPPAWVSSKVQ